METAVGQMATEPLMEEQEQECDLDAFRRQAVGIAAAIALQQHMTFKLAQIVAELVESIGRFGELEGGQDRLIDLLGGPATDCVAAVQEDLQQTNDAGLVDLN